MLPITTSLFVAAAFCMVANAGERVITCGTEDVHRLSCDSGVIRVETALYGRTDRQICSQGRSNAQVDSTRCSQNGTLDVLAQRCNGKKVCELQSRNVFSSPDPCPRILKYLDSTHLCLPAISVLACEGSVATLQCDVGQIIAVRGADYGRRDRTTCSMGRSDSDLQKIDCSGSSLQKVAESCNGKNSCILDVNNSEFGDPCRGTYKYLELAYTCEG